MSSWPVAMESIKAHAEPAWQIGVLCVLLLLAAAAFAAPVMVVDSQSEYWLPLDAEGWTVVENTDPSAVTIYVSSSEGNDENDGLSAESPVATLAQARTLCRNASSWTGQPGFTTLQNYIDGTDTIEDSLTWYSDTILLKCGDAWPAETLPLTQGESPQNPFLYSSYGTGTRPIVYRIRKVTNPDAAYDNWCVIGIEFANTIEILNAQYETYGWGRPSHVLIEDCVVRMEVDLQIVDYISIRRSMIVDSWSSSVHKQGIYLEDVSKPLIEECVLDHNGWHDSETGAEPTMYNHNMYIKQDCYGTIMRGNISARASATGAQLRCGGAAVDNLFIENPVALNWGLVVNSPITPGGVTGEITDNVILGDADICRPRPGCTPGDPLGAGIQIANVASGTCTGNIVSTRITDPDGQSFITLTSDMSALSITNLATAGNIGINNFTLQNNICYGWDGGIRLLGDIYSSVVIDANDVQDATATKPVAREDVTGWSGLTLTGNRYYSGGANLWRVNGSNTTFANWVTETGETGSETQVVYTDPTRSIASYMATLGYSVEDQTVEKFLELARANSKADWDERFTAAPVNDYIRAGFAE